MNHLYVNFFFTHEREGFWHPVQLDRGRERCFQGICDRRCLLAARGDSARNGQGETPYCAWLIPCEGEALGHFQMVEGGKGEIGRVYNPYVIRFHLPSALPDHPLARAFPPAKHALLTQFYRHGHKASYHFAKDEAEFEWELGRAEQQHAMAIYNQHPEWLQVFLELAKDFLWDFPSLAALPPSVGPAPISPLLLPIKGNCHD